MLSEKINVLKERHYWNNGFMFIYPIAVEENIAPALSMLLIAQKFKDKDFDKVKMDHGYIVRVGFDGNKMFVVNISKDL